MKNSSASASRGTSSFSIALLLAALGLLPAGPAILPVSAQVEVREVPSASFGERIEVELVSVEVFVTDRRGRSITGLTRDDFEVIEDGKPVEVSHFSGPRDPLGLLDLGLTDDEAPPESGAPEASVGGIPLLVVYFDSLHLQQKGREKVLEAVESFLQGQRVPAERVMVINQTHRLEVLAPFGSSQRVLHRALQEVGGSAPGGQRIDRSRRNIIQTLYQHFDNQELILRRRQGTFVGEATESSAGVCAQVEGAWRGEIESYSAQVGLRAGQTLEHLTFLTDSLAGLPGVKALLYVGNGLELTPGADILTFASQICPRLSQNMMQSSRQFNLVEGFEDLTLQANSNRITFFTVEAAGLRTLSHGQVEYGTAQFTPSAGTDLQWTGNLQGGLTYLADETGGRAVLNTNRFDRQLEQIGQDLGGYYSLAYTPPKTRAGKDHRIKVKIKDRKGLRLRHRRGYREQPPGQELETRLLSAVTLGWISNALGVKVSHGEEIPYEEGKGTFLVPLRFTVPLSNLVFLPEGEGRIARVRVLLGARDPKGRLSSLHGKSYEIRLAPGTPMAGVHNFTFTTEMRPGPQEVAVALRDESGGDASFVVYPLEIGDSPLRRSKAAKGSDSSKASKR